MIIEKTTQNGFTIATITSQEASLRNANDFKEAMIKLIDEGNRHVILSFERVTYVDSSFLGSMVIALKHAIAKGADMYLVQLRSDIYDLLSLIRMNKVFKIFDTPEQAIKNLQ